MPVELRCPDCGAALFLPEAEVGWQISCRHCHAPLITAIKEPDQSRPHLSKPYSWNIEKHAILITSLLVLLLIGILVLPAIQQAREAASRTQSRENLKAIGQAILQYEQERLSFPETAIKDEQGKPLLSWRVRLLPYLGHAELYEQFDLTQPWNSEHNRKLIEQMPELFQCPEMDNGEFTTNYLLVVGPDTIFSAERATTRQEFLDDLQDTIILVEANADQAVIWTQPGDLAYDPQHPRQGLGKLRRGLDIALLADGSVQMISHNINQEILKALMSKSADVKKTFEEQTTKEPTGI